MGITRGNKPEAHRSWSTTRKFLEALAAFQNSKFKFVNVARHKYEFRQKAVPYQIDDAPVPYKNASTIEFNDGIHTCHKKRCGI